MILAAFIRLVGERRTVEIFGVKLIGVDRFNAKRLLFTLILCVGLFVLSRVIKAIVHVVLQEWKNKRVVFWVRQVINVVLAITLIIGVVSIWFEQGSNLTTFVGLVTAGVAFALQQVITALAGYIVILRGRTFTVGDRIVMGGVRGDVVALGFIQTTIMEMGEPPAEQSDSPSMWVKSRQYTGRIVTISNAKIFDNPVYNYTRDFPYIWEEMTLPISYKDDRKKAEQILLDVAAKHALKTSDLNEEDIKEVRRRYAVELDEIVPKVYMRLTDNWVELTVRFLCREHGVRGLKDKMSREVIDQLDAAKIGIASSTYDIVGFPPLRIIHEENEPKDFPGG
jgi:small-conductance mechanosensitive channel